MSNNKRTTAARWLTVVAGASLLNSAAAAQVVIDDDFNDGDLGTNPGTGSGFSLLIPPPTWQPFYISEGGGNAILSSDNPGGNTNTFGNISSNDTFNPFLATQGTRITWEVSSIQQRPLGRGIIGLSRTGTINAFFIQPNGGGVGIQVAGDYDTQGPGFAMVSDDGPGSLVFWTTGGVRHIVADWSWGIGSTSVPSTVSTRGPVTFTLELTDTTYSLEITGASIYNLNGSLSGPLPVAPSSIGTSTQVYAAAQAWFNSQQRPMDQDGYTRIEIDRVLVERFDLAPPNSPPTAVAGVNQSIRAGDTVYLDGSDSCDDNTATALLDYAWSFFSKPGESGATLTDANTATPSFEADVAGTYVVQLVVTDEAGLDSDPATVEISSDNLAPTSDAGEDDLVIVGTAVTLDGSGSSDPEFETLTYSWVLTTVPGGSSATLNDATAETPSFTADVAGVYVVTLEVSDFIGPGAPDSVTITATSAEDYAEFQILCAATIIQSLDAGQVTTKGNKRAFLNFLSQAVKAIQNGHTATAIDKLEKCIARTDGCEANGAPDGNGPGRDWITDCEAQAEILACLRDALAALSP